MAKKYKKAKKGKKNPPSRKSNHKSEEAKKNKPTQKSQKMNEKKNEKFEKKEEKTEKDEKNKNNSKISKKDEKIIKSPKANDEVELDQAVEDVNRYIVVAAKPSEYIDKYYSVTLNYTNVKNNNNKFYIIQLLQDVYTKKYGILYRWGRVGKFGQVNFVAYENFEDAQMAFLTKLQNKEIYGYTKIKTEAKIKAKNDNDINDMDEEGLEKHIVNLLKLVFDIKSFNQQMQDFGYDSNKIPLGQLSLEVINEGYIYLKELENIIESSNNSNYSNKIYELSSKYYTLIPHNFGMYHMANFLINSMDKVQKEYELLESIKNIKEVTGILNSEKDNEEKISLKEKLDEFIYTINYIPKEDVKYQIIEQYLVNSNDIKNSPKIKLNDLFEVAEKNVSEKTMLNFDNNNKMLLWYGISISNFVNVFKNGLNLPSKEAPIFSYMFGKGIYFSDVAIKSFYNSRPQNNIGIMLLCEVQLGNIEERDKADIKLPSTLGEDKNSVKVLGMNYPDQNGNYIDENGIIIPTGKVIENKDENNKRYFGFNEYIVYNLEQIKIKYITKVQFDK